MTALMKEPPTFPVTIVQEYLQLTTREVTVEAPDTYTATTIALEEFAKDAEEDGRVLVSQWIKQEDVA